jgi:polyphosphate kinase 2 (PPK2 family)
MPKQVPEEIRPKMTEKDYEKELRKLQTELCRLQDCVVHTGLC